MLARERKRLPFSSAFILLAIPAYAIWGPVAAFVGAGYYLVGMRRSHKVDEIAEREARLADTPAVE